MTRWGLTDSQIRTELDKLADSSANPYGDDDMSNLVDFDQLHEEYDELLDMDGTVPAGGYDFFPSKILSELDPIAYSCGFNNYVDSLVQDGVLIEHLDTGDLYYNDQSQNKKANSDYFDKLIDRVVTEQLKKSRSETDRKIQAHLKIDQNLSQFE